MEYKKSIKNIFYLHPKEDCIKFNKIQQTIYLYIF